MTKHVYISCDYHERSLPAVLQLASLLHAAGCVLEWAPAVDRSFYRVLEERIDRCDVFLAIAGMGYSCSTWLNHELEYAAGLKRPRLFALSLDGYTLPACSRHIEVEWLASPEEFGRVLEPFLNDHFT